MSSDHYGALGVGPDATTDEIKAAYWRLARQHHVALAAGSAAGRRAAGGPGSGDPRLEEAERELARLDEAYAVLVDPQVRLQYHTSLAGAAPTALPARPACVVCGGVPAAPAVLKEVTGLLVRYRVDELREAFCNRCGTAAYRTAQSRTLLRGWWGVFALFHNWAAVGSNWAMRRRFDALPAPERPGHWPDGSPRPSLDPGAPLWLRPKLLLGGAVILGLAVAAVVDTFFV